MKKNLLIIIVLLLVSCNWKQEKKNRIKNTIKESLIKKNEVFKFTNDTKIGKINDADGYTNLREKPNTKSKIISKLLLNDFFFYNPNKTNKWYKVKDLKGNVGFVHKSRIREIIKPNIKIKYIEKGTKDTTIFSQKKYILDDITVRVRQLTIRRSNFCISNLVVYKKNTIIDSLGFVPESLGGDYGISKGEIVNKHLIFQKEGDYDGRTLIINNQGKIFNIKGGTSYYDGSSDLIFSIYSSDISGITVFDLKKDEQIFSNIDYELVPISIHKDFGNRYFMKTIGNETDKKEIWEFKFDLNRILRVEINYDEMNNENELELIKSGIIYCGCDE